MHKKEQEFPVDELGCLFYWCRRDHNELYYGAHIKPNQRHVNSKVTWIQNTIFEDTMQIIDTYEEKTVVQSEKTGFYYAIYPSDLCKLLLISDVERGKIQGEWCYVRRGNYGIKLYKT